MKTSLVLCLVLSFCASCCSTSEKDGLASTVGGATEAAVVGTWNIDLVRAKEDWFEIGLKWERQRAASRPGEPMTEAALRSRAEASTGELLAMWKGSTLIFNADGTCSFNQQPFKHRSYRGKGGRIPARYTSSGSTVTVVTDTKGAVIVVELEGDTLTGEMVPPPEAPRDGKPAIPVVFQRG